MTDKIRKIKYEKRKIETNGIYTLQNTTKGKEKKWLKKSECEKDIEGNVQAIGKRQ